MTVLRRQVIFTPRRVRVLQLAAAGYGNQETAEELGVTLETVKTHWRIILAGIGARNRTEAVALAFRTNLLP